MQKFWRVFWFVRLFVAAYLTCRCVLVWSDFRLLVKELVYISIWTMWTSDLPDGKEDA